MSVDLALCVTIAFGLILVMLAHAIDNLSNRLERLEGTTDEHRAAADPPVCDPREHVAPTPVPELNWP